MAALLITQYPLIHPPVSPARKGADVPVFKFTADGEEGEEEDEEDEEPIRPLFSAAGRTAGTRTPERMPSYAQVPRPCSRNDRLTTT